MNPYLEPAGFLGTGASLLADLTLIAYLLLIVPAMLIGYWFARRGKHRPHHQWLMIGVTAINWVLIIFLMIVAYRFDVIDNILDQPSNARYLLPTVHGLLGLPAQLLATFTVVRMAVEDRNVAAAKRRGETNLRKYWFLQAKPVMQVTLGLWLATATLGVASYLVRYDVIQFTGGVQQAEDEDLRPVATEDVAATEEPVSTPEILSTDEVIVTPEVAETREVEADDDDGDLRSVFPLATVEVEDNDDGGSISPRATAEVVSTPEVEDDDDSGSGNSGRGSGNSGSGGGSGNSGSGASGGGGNDDDDD